MSRTDLASEISPESGLTVEKSTISGIEITKVNIDKKASERTKKPAGNYVTLSCKQKNAEAEAFLLAEILAKMLSGFNPQKVLITGLGNDNVTPDSLGVRAAEKVLATAHFKSSEEFTDLGLKEVYVIEPGVMAQTGLESASHLKFIADGIEPDCLIVIDSLACKEKERLATTIQVTDTGIAPGSGVKNQRQEFSQSVFGVPVIAIGVPTVIDIENLLLIPKDVDVIILHFAKVISMAINRVLNPSLDESEIEGLLV